MKKMCLTFGLSALLLLIQACRTTTRPCPVQADNLLNTILQQQRCHVRESYGLEANECFTWVDLNEFKKSDAPSQIVQQLRQSERFRAIIDELSQKPESMQKQYLQKCRTLAHPTWAYLGRISPEGQTDAGQEAELLIAASIANLAQEMLVANSR